MRRMSMRHLGLLAALALAVVPVADASASSGKIYRWVDENGVVHFGDAIPPEYSKERHEVQDERGVRTAVHEERVAEPVQSDRDRALLATYGSVAEIEDVRDRRTGYLDSQNDVARDRLEGLKARRTELQDNPNAMNELATVTQRIGEYEAEIARRNQEIERIRGDFAADIRRFRELKGLPEQAEPAPPQ